MKRPEDMYAFTEKDLQEVNNLEFTIETALAKYRPLRDFPLRWDITPKVSRLTLEIVKDRLMQSGWTVYETSEPNASDPGAVALRIAPSYRISFDVNGKAIAGDMN